MCYRKMSSGNYLYKDAFNNGPWHRDRQSPAPRRVSPLSSSVGSCTEMKTQCVQGRAIWEEASKESRALAPEPAILPCLLVNIYEKRKLFFIPMLLGWSQFGFYVLMVLGHSSMVIPFSRTFLSHSSY
jgi:hypothetical protein